MPKPILDTVRTYLSWKRLAHLFTAWIEFEIDLRPSAAYIVKFSKSPRYGVAQNPGGQWYLTGRDELGWIVGIGYKQDNGKRKLISIQTDIIDWRECE